MSVERVLALFLVLTVFLSGHSATWATSNNSRLSAEESQLINVISGTTAYGYDLELERIALDQTISGYSFRSSGTAGAKAAAEWIKQQFEGFGLDTRIESYEFNTWNLSSAPRLIIDDDGDFSTSDDQVAIKSFQAEHYSWPTPKTGVIADLLFLPLPPASSPSGVEVPSEGRYDGFEQWSRDFTGKILLIGREVRLGTRLNNVFVNRLKAQPPAAVIFTWSYQWMSWAVPSFSSMGGLPVASKGPYLWDLKIPVGWIDYSDGQWIKTREAEVNVSAHVIIDATLEIGQHQNVVGRLQGSTDPNRMIIVSANYDSVMCPGFGDNGAGTAAIIELVRVFSEANQQGTYKPRATLLFVAFAGGELGLAGSVDYVRRHQAELKDVIAVVNLKSIGGKDLTVSETYPDDAGISLQDIAVRAAEDIGVAVKTLSVGGSDQETFRNPKGTDDFFYTCWRIRPGIENATRVKSSIMISSYPMFQTDIWDVGIPGYARTAYDNSTSTETLDWIAADRLQTHIQVALLSILRVADAYFNPLLMNALIVVTVATVAVGVAIYFKRTRAMSFLRHVRDDINSHIELKETIYVVMLMAVLMFSSVSVHARPGTTEITDDGEPKTVSVLFIGAPFEMVAISSPTAPLRTLGVLEPMPVPIQYYDTSVLVLWKGLLLNVALFFSIAFAITYGASKLASLIRRF